VERAGGLDNALRRWLHDPRKILGSYVRPGMTAVDFGCGPGAFTLAMAELAGEAGKVYAVDLQPAMLDILRRKLAGNPLAPRIVLHEAKSDRIGLSGPVDFILAFYVVHELPDPVRFFREAKSILKPGGMIYAIEPSFHVSKADFAATVEAAIAVGFKLHKTEKMRLSRAAILLNAG
jgi:ubiquinone/menaquinone biosynthesis C-methylase UbiE